jgi:predicted peroxiredoxin
MSLEIVFLYGWGPEEEGRLSSLLYMVETAVAMNMQVAVFFFTDAAVLARREVFAKFGQEIRRRMDVLIGNEKVKFFVCEQATRKRGILKEALQGGMTVIGHAAFLDMATSANTVITI